MSKIKFDDGSSISYKEAADIIRREGFLTTEAPIHVDGSRCAVGVLENAKLIQTYPFQTTKERTITDSFLRNAIMMKNDRFEMYNIEQKGNIARAEYIAN